MSVALPFAWEGYGMRLLMFFYNMKCNRLIIATAACSLFMAMAADVYAAKATEAVSHRQKVHNTTNAYTTGLETSIAEAESLIANATDYLPGLVADLEDAVIDARNILNGNSSQNTINQANSTLKANINRVKASYGKTFDATPHAEEYVTDRGFVHPGGLHTQEDFDRVKRLLKQGNPLVKQAMSQLRNDPLSQATAKTTPTKYIKRGGGDGENYMNAAKGAAVAYLNALRWKIDGTKDNADNAVKVLMDWANYTEGVTGDTNLNLALGLYGYAFAQAAELMRDYEGWSRDDFETFRQWMLKIWYPGIIQFLRSRCGSWENAGKWWQAPGHYWSNWGLCNDLALLTIGVLCDDVFIYNQALSFLKYDQVGTFTDPRTTDPILCDGLTDFWGNLIVTTVESDLETGAYGKLGQMNESGRDIGHATMACGLAVDLAHMAWNQGDDLFSYMDNRLAAGVEYIAAQIQSVENLPWTNYHYCTGGFHYSDSRSWLMTEPALGEQIRPYWGTVIGHYESVKGVKMPFSEKVYEKMGVDRGGQGNTSGGYDHLGYSVLMNTRDFQLAPADSIPALITPMMEYDGEIIGHNELGGLKNTYVTDKNKCLPRGKTVKLMPQLAEGEEDTGNWIWNTGETTKDITVSTDKSYAYRVTYTNKNNVKSHQVFTIAVDADCNPSPRTTGMITYKGVTAETDTITVYYGETVTLTINGIGAYESYEWDNGSHMASVTTNPLVRPRDFTGVYINQGGVRSPHKFHVNVKYMDIQAKVNGVVINDTLDFAVNAGDNVEIGPYVPSALAGCTYKWNTGETTRTINIDGIETSGKYVLDYVVNGEKGQLVYNVFVNAAEDCNIAEGDYFVCDRLHNTVLTNNGVNQKCTMQQRMEGDDALAQVWHITNNGQGYHNLKSLKDGLYLQVSTRATATETHGVIGFRKAVGADYYELHNKLSYYWQFDDNGTIVSNVLKAPCNYPLVFQLFDVNAISLPDVTEDMSCTIYNIMGQKLSQPVKGLNIINGKKVMVRAR